MPDPQHDHAAWLAAQTNRGGVQEQYKRDDIPSYRAYAQQYSLCDNYFTDVTSQSEPNHLHLIAATSPIIDNSSNDRLYQPFPRYDLESLPATLEAAGMMWRNYAAPRSSYFDHITALAGQCDRAASKMVARSSRSAACQLSDRHGGMRRRASSQSKTAGAWSRRSADAGEIRVPVFQRTEDDFRDSEAMCNARP